jgi:hypothetical protein
MPERGDPYVWYVGKVWRYQKRWSESMNRKKDRQLITKW